MLCFSQQLISLWHGITHLAPNMQNPTHLLNVFTVCIVRWRARIWISSFSELEAYYVTLCFGSLTEFFIIFVSLRI